MAKSKTMCPNCGGEAERMEKDGRIYVLCPKEDKIYQITDTGAKLAARGKIAEIEARLAALEQRKADPPADPAGGDDDDGDGDSIDLELEVGDDDD